MFWYGDVLSRKYLNERNTLRRWSNCIEPVSGGLWCRFIIFRL